MSAKFDNALFGAQWDLSVADQAYAKYLERRAISPELALGSYLSAIAALKGAKESLALAEKEVRS